MEAPDMKAGTKYLLIYTASAERFTRRAVMTYLGKDYGSGYMFDARPAAGTQILYAEQMLAVSPADPDAEHYVNERGGSLPERKSE